VAEEFEDLFEEPEELPATAAPAAGTTASASSDLEGVVEAVERALRRLNGVLAVHDVACGEGRDYECIFADGSLACGGHYTWEELSEVADKARRFSRLAALIHDLYRRGMLPDDVSVYILRPREPRIVADAAIFGPHVVLAHVVGGQRDLYYVFHLSEKDACVVHLGFDADWRLETTALYVGLIVAHVVREKLLDIVQRACLPPPGNFDTLAQVRRLARKLSQL
jgi:hypothetical protein